MKKLITAVVLLPFTISAHASTNWILVAENSSGFVYYVDQESLKKKKDSVSFMLRINNGYEVNGEKSSKSQNTINCNTLKQIKTGFIESYDDLDNKGKMISNSRSRDTWKTIPHGSVLRVISDFICKQY